MLSPVRPARAIRPALLLLLLPGVGCEIDNPRYTPLRDLSAPARGDLSVLPDLGQVPLVSTIAGNGMAAFADGPGGPFGAARLNYPVDVLLDSRGNLLVADSGNHRIRMIDPAGRVTTMAGGDMSGDLDGPAQGDGMAQFVEPRGLALDGAGNLFVADLSNNRIRKIGRNGIVTTVAGTGVAGSMDGAGGRNGVAQFDGPTGVVLDDAGNLYVAEANSHAIRKIAPDGTVSTFAGKGMQSGLVNDRGGAARFNGPRSLTRDAAGNLYVADTDNHCIRKIDPAGSVSTFSGNCATAGYKDGPADVAHFNQPKGLRSDDAGNLYVTEFVNHRIRKVDPAGTVTTVAGDGVAGFMDGAGPSAQFNAPEGVVHSVAGALFIADSGNNRVRKIDNVP